MKSLILYELFSIKQLVSFWIRCLSCLNSVLKIYTFRIGWIINSLAWLGKVCDCTLTWPYTVLLKTREYVYNIYCVFSLPIIYFPCSMHYSFFFPLSYLYFEFFLYLLPINHSYLSTGKTIVCTKIYNLFFCLYAINGTGITPLYINFFMTVLCCTCA